MTNLKTLFITLGDPNGLGPELVVRHLAENKRTGFRMVLVGPEEPLEYHLKGIGGSHLWQTIDDSLDIDRLPEGIYAITPPDLLDFPITPGRATVEGGESAGISLEMALELMKNVPDSALVTCPLNKAMLKEAGYEFGGHTEFLATRAGLAPEDVCMHLAGPRLRVSLVTTHPPLKKVPELITEERVCGAIMHTMHLLDALGESGAPLAVCGLNPHAGESGAIGDEEERIIIPAINKAREQGAHVVGPLPGDTIFRRAYKGEFGAVVAMYHDQGLAPLKLVHFAESVNITLGLGFVRTSPDHGTGYDLVGSYRAETGGFAAAMAMAARLLDSPILSSPGE